MKVYFKLIENSGHFVRYASPDKQIVLNNSYPVALQIYGANRTRAYVLADTKALFETRYGNNIELVNIDEMENN
ncbi:hypothetical protein [Leuconostoc citreum]|uniref:hypothetical protein n=1 Tax=Leuconostoc citreum TaxID=33964 RepID=UPI00186B8109|nr:hypothetical protein [Leuconostoc citreum]MBE4726365.1 hypothetical protein [Leuconostoc citreum]